MDLKDTSGIADLTKKANQKKLDDCKKELIKMVQGWEKKGITLDAQIVPIPNGLIAQPVLRVLKDDGSK